MLTRGFQSGSPHSGFLMLASPILFALKLCLELVTAGNTFRTMELVLPNLAPFLLTPIYGCLELLNQFRTDGTLPTVWVEDLITITQRS